jgi:hypothetical protein
MVSFLIEEQYVVLYIFIYPPSMKISQKLTLTVLAGFILSCNVQAAGPNDCKENERWVQIGAD